MTDFLTISYRSKGVLTDPVNEVASIVAQSQPRNAALGITGILLFDGRYFMQTIEGPPATTTDLFQSIANDDRHEDIRPFGRHELEERDFPDWHMELLGPDETAQIVPDLKRFGFSYRRLREVQAMAAEVAKQKRARRTYH